MIRSIPSSFASNISSFALRTLRRSAPSSVLSSYSSSSIASSINRNNRQSSISPSSSSSSRSMSLLAPLPCFATPSSVLAPPTPSSTIFFVCDMQETFRSKILDFESVLAASVFLSRASQALGIPILTTEQTPFKGTVQELQAYIQPSSAACTNKVYSKSMFSMLAPSVISDLDSIHSSRRHVVLYGVEAHVCVLQTAIDLVRRGYHVHVPIDGIGSQYDVDKQGAIMRLTHAGAMAAASSQASPRSSSLGSLSFTSAESIIFEILGDAKHASFKSLLPCMKEFAATKRAKIDQSKADQAAVSKL